jgi:hypothetical protein
MVNIKQFKLKADAVRSLIADVKLKNPKCEDTEMLDGNFDELYNMIISVSETLDTVLSDIEK